MLRALSSAAGLRFSFSGGQGSSAATIDQENVERMPRDLLERFKVLAFSISSKQFGHRVAPAQMLLSKLDGINVTLSAKHTLDLIHTWLGEESLSIFPSGISASHLLELCEQLKTLIDISVLHHGKTGNDECKAAAEDTLEQLRASLDERGLAYCHFSYIGELSRGGHAICVKFRDLGSSIEVTTLNLGEGIEQHAQLAASNKGYKYNFQSYPIIIDKKVLYSPRGSNAIARLIKLSNTDSLFAEKQFSAADIVATLRSLGTVSTVFPDPERRCRLPQLGNTCGDMVSQILVQDFLIDQGYDKTAITRFSYLEKLFATLAFHAQLQKSGNPPRDDWILLKKAVEDLAVKEAKSNATILGDEERAITERTLGLIKSTAVEKIQGREDQQVSPVYSLVDQETFLFTLKGDLSSEKINILDTLLVPSTSTALIDTTLLPLNPSKDATFCLTKWTLRALELLTSKNYQEFAYFVFQNILSLECPSANAPDAWDEMPIQDIPEFLDHLSRFARLLEQFPIDFAYAHTISLHTLYAITDKLVRRLYPNEFHQFYSPFIFLTDEGLEGQFSEKERRLRFDFKALPHKKINSRWVEICTYFENGKKEKTHGLFPKYAVNLEDASKDLEDDARLLSTSSPAVSYLHFLKQFVDTQLLKTEPLEMLLAKLWIHEEGSKMPDVIKFLYSFSYIANKSVRFGVVNHEQFFTIPYSRNDNELIFRPTQGGFVDFSVVMKSKTLGMDMPPVLDRQCSENQSQCLVHKDATLPPHRVLEWTRIFSSPQLQITSVGLWISENIMDLSNDSIQKLVLEGLFVPGLLEKTLAHEPEILCELRETLLRASDIFLQLEDETDTVAFLMQVMISLETFSSSPSKGSFLACENRLLRALDRRSSPKLNQALLFLYCQDLPRGEESLLECMKARSTVQIQGREGLIFPHLANENIAVTNMRQGEILKALENPSWRESCFKLIFQTLLPTEDLPSSPAQCEGIQIVKGNYRIDLSHCHLYSEKGQLLFLKKDMRKTFGIGSPNGSIWADESSLSSVNGLERITLQSLDSSSKSSAFHKFRMFPQLQKAYGNIWYCKSKASSEIFNCCKPFLEDPYELWHAGAITVICSKEDGQIHAVMEKGPGDMHKVWRYTSSGRTGEVLLNTWDQKSQIAKYFHALGMQDEALAWTQEGSSQLSRLEFLSSNLSFIGENHEGAWKLRSSQYPDYFFAKEQEIEEINRYEGAIALESSHQSAILFPFKSFKVETNSFSTRVSPSHTYENSQTFFFELPPNALSCKSESSMGYLFLTLLFASQRDYEKALVYLAKSKVYENILISVSKSRLCNQFYSLRDYSPEGLAFSLRFALFLLRNQKQFLLSRFEEKEHNSNGHRFAQNEAIVLSKWAGKTFERYLRVRSSGEVSRVPAYLRLTDEEELEVLKFMRPHLLHSDELWANEDSNNLWLPLFDHRIALIENGTHSSTIYPQVHPVLVEDAQNFDLRSITEHSPPLCTLGAQAAVRFPSDYDPYFLQKVGLQFFRKHFIELYESMLKPEGALDLFYLLRNYASYTTPAVKSYIALLQYIHINPTLFAGIRFSCTDAATYQSIIETYQKGLGKNPLSLIAGALKARTVFFQAQVEFLYYKSCKMTHKRSIVLPRDSEVFQSLKPSSFHPLQTSFLEKLQSDIKVDRHAFLDPKETPFIFEGVDPSLCSFTKGEMILQQKRGYDRLCDPENGLCSYSYQGAGTASTCLAKAEEELQAVHAESQRVLMETEAAANSIPKSAVLLSLEKIGLSRPEIRMNGILSEAYMDQNVNAIRQANPSLSPVQIREILSGVISYHLLRIREHQLSQAISILKRSGSVQDFAEALEVHGVFNPCTEPELIISQSRTGKILWKKQAELIGWLIETSGITKKHPRIFSARAGLGKTTVVLPWLVKRIMREGLSPITVSSAPLYSSDREELKHSVQAVFGLDLDVIEISLDDLLTTEDLEDLYTELSANTGKKALKITPTVFYSLYLKKQIALETRDVEAAKWLGLILEHFKTKCHLLVDECRINLSPFTQAKIGLGRTESLPMLDLQIMIDIYKGLTNSEICLPDGRSIKDTVGLEGNLQAMMSLDDRSSVIATLLSHKSLWLRTYEEIAASRVEGLVETYFTTYFSKAMDLVGGMRHLRSTKKGEKVHKPADAKQVSEAYFEDPYLTVIATIHGYLQEGIRREEDVRDLLSQLQDEHLAEVAYDSRVSSIEMKLREWTKCPELRLHSFSIDSSSSLQRFYAHIKSNKEVLFYYLEKTVLKQVQSTTEQVSATPAHFRNAFYTSTIFSADPGPEEIYGVYEESSNVRYDESFLAHVTHTFLAPENQNFLQIDTSGSPGVFFSSLFKQTKIDLSQLDMICDAGGMLRDFSHKEIVDGFFTFLEEERTKEEGEEIISYDGMLIYEQSLEKKEEMNLLFYDTKSKKPQILSGHDIPAAFSRIGLKWGDMKLLSYIDPSHRAGANFPQGKSILLLIGEDLSLSNGIQGALRARGLLQKKQRLIWGMSAQIESSVNKMQKGDRSFVYNLLDWLHENEEKNINAEALLAAYQNIECTLANFGMIEGKSCDTAARQIDKWHKQRQALVLRNDTDPLRHQFADSVPRPSQEVLWAFVQERFSRYKYPAAMLDPSTKLYQELKTIITSVSRRYIDLPQGNVLSTSQKTYVHTHQEQKLEQMQVRNKDGVSAEEVVSLPRLHIEMKDFTKKMIAYCSPVREVFGSKHLSSRLYITPNALRTGKTVKGSLLQDYLKPIQYILLVKEGENWRAFALADVDAIEFQTQLEVLHPSTRQLALIRSNGSIVRNKGISKAEMKDSFVEDVLSDVGLFTCQLKNLERFSRRAETWDDFWPMWARIKAGQILPAKDNIASIEQLITKSIKR